MSSGCAASARRWQESGNAVKRFGGKILEQVTKVTEPIWPKGGGGGGPQGPQGPGQAA